MGLFRTRKAYFRYNPKTLEYERVYLSGKERFVAGLKDLSVGLMIGVMAFIAFIFFYPSPKEKLLQKENKLLLTQYDMLLMDLRQTSDVLEDLQQRDENLYRAIFNADSIPSSIRKSGFGGSNRYEHLKGLPNSDLVMETTLRMDILKKQLYIQSVSLDELISLGQGMEDRLHCIPAIQPIANKEMKQTASGYGMRIDPIYRIPMPHTGIDFIADTGTDVYATGDGKIIQASWKQGYGNCIIIDHGYDYKTLYGHLSKYYVKEGQKVIRGEVIAAVGNTGRSVGPHLHYEVWYKGHHTNPVNYFYQDLTPEEYDKMIQIAENHGKVFD